MNALDWKGRLTRRPYLGRSAKCWLRNLTKTFSMPPGSRVIEISSLVFTDLAAVVSTLQTVNSTTFLPINLSLHTISVLRISFSTWIRSTGCTATRGGAHKTYGAYFPDLASNMLGSFVMGLLTAAPALKGEGQRAVAILPENHAWQDTPELMVGLRTGFCGSLTTFASWQLSLVSLLIGGRGYQGGQWAEFLWGQIIGLQLALSSYMFGAHLAANVNNMLHVPKQHARGWHKDKRNDRRWHEWSHGEAQKASGSAGRVSADAHHSSEDKSDNARELQQKQIRGDGWDLEEQGGSAESDCAGQDQGDVTLVGSKHIPQFRKTHLATLVMLVLLTSLWIVLAIVDSSMRHSQRRRQWFALLFSPFGALLRWKLALMNGKLPSARWLPLGTLAANVAACCIDFGTQAGLQRIHVPGYWVTLLLKAVQTGFSGALSTVSTFVAEVEKMPGDQADNVHGYIYGLLTICCGALSGIVVYGWSVWA